MINKDILVLAETLSNEKGLEKQVVFEALEAALAMASRKASDIPNMDARVSIDQETGDYETFRIWTVVNEEDYEFIERHYTLEEAKEVQSDLDLGDTIEEPIESCKFGRIEAQAAKQVILQEVRKAVRAKMVKDYEDRVGELVNGTVKRVTREAIYVDLGGNAEAVIRREDMLPREIVRVNDRIRAYLFEVNTESRSPQILLSRTHPDMLKALFEVEVPEIGEGVISVKACARDPGNRAKVAVKTNDGRIDPIGACVGMRGARVQAVSSELSGERIDIVQWDSNPAQFVINILAPAEVTSIVVDEEKHSMDVAVADEQLALTIGRNGQNIRLAAELSGWTLNVMNAEDAQAKSESEAEKTVAQFVEELEIEADLAALLVQEGFISIEEIAYVDEAELLNLEGLDEESVAELRNRAKDVMLTKALVSDAAEQPQDDLLNMDGMTEEMAEKLAKHSILSMEDLAEQAVDELLEIEELGLNEQKAAQLIMTARAPWFEEEDSTK
ncbi:MAG: transcription termination/antitermination protein NusA [marine bacterium B5-7]|nr:MAG: transcription termination/antitermination protein NusA [marine bacterium B5-7]